MKVLFKRGLSIRDIIIAAVPLLSYAGVTDGMPVANACITGITEYGENSTSLTSDDDSEVQTRGRQAGLR